MEAVSIEQVQKDPKFFELFNTNQKHAKFEIQLCPGHPSMHHEGKKIKTDAIVVYARISGLSEAMLDHDVTGCSVKNNILTFP
eukprot:10728401-Ditylum_brightwellii.AAC.1